MAMRRGGLLTGMILGGMIGVYYGMSMNGKRRARMRHMADDVIDRGGDVVDSMMDRAHSLMERIM